MSDDPQTPPSRGEIESHLERLLHEQSLMGRRRFLGRSAGAIAMTGGLGAFLAACGIKGTAEQNVAQLSKIAASVNHPKVPIGNWTFSNWPLYIDKSVLKEFDAEYGGHVKYVEEINDNNEFFGKVRPQLTSGKPIGRDIVVLTDPMAARWVRSAFVTPIDKRNVPNGKNLVDSLLHPPYDPERLFTLPWQSGALGLGYDIKATGRELKSIKEFFNPEWKGKVTMFLDAQDSASTVLIGEGKDPAKSSLDDHLAAVEKIGKAAKQGQFRRFTGNDYSTDLTKGNIVLALAYSGDMVQLQSDNPNLRFAYPEEGAILWTDNMMMPAKVQHPYAAETMMNFVYEPEVAAKIAAYVNYIPPVKGVQELLEKSDPELASNPLIFPTPEISKRFFAYAQLSSVQRQDLDRAMAAVTGG
ncbi:MAG: spermidine/putrescine ABC transporter substrate-binding protein [Solirubrobacteraceae bacterium]|nr:spermidine/putrescine ABC transporter substrate-binding protein [Solirubrobacteraceae bacterium]